jgi:hypothetical protein
VGVLAAVIPLGNTLSLLERYRIESGAKARLRDPDSARFSDIRFVRTHDGVHVCGWVNAKNGFGGYGEAMQFYGVLDNYGWFDLRAIDTEKPQFGDEATASAACKRM